MKWFISLILIFALFAFPQPVHAVCPICTIAVGIGLGISRWIGIDDVVTGIWIGGLIVSSGLWLAAWLGKRGWQNQYKEIVSILVMALFVLPPLYLSKMIGIPNNRLWGIDKVLLGSLIGASVFIVGVFIDTWLRSTNNQKVYIYFQKVIVPVFMLTVTSFALYLITR